MEMLLLHLKCVYDYERKHILLMHYLFAGRDLKGRILFVFKLKVSNIYKVFVTINVSSSFQIRIQPAHHTHLTLAMSVTLKLFR